jgi:MFS family permease
MNICRPRPSGSRRPDRLPKTEHPSDWRILFPLVAAGFAAAMSMTIMPVAVPAVSRAFALAQDQVHWVSTGFMAAMTFSMLLTPWLIGRFSVRRIYEGSVLLLLMGATCASLAPNFLCLVLARLLEGVAAGTLQPLPVIVVSHALTQGQRGRAMGLFTLGTVLAPAVSPMLGGLLVGSWGWRAVSLALVPVALLALPMGRWLKPHELRGAHGSTAPGRLLDFRSLWLGGVALLGVLVACSVAQRQRGGCCFLCFA